MATRKFSPYQKGIQYDSHHQENGKRDVKEKIKCRCKQRRETHFIFGYRKITAVLGGSLSLIVDHCQEGKMKHQQTEEDRNRKDSRLVDANMKLWGRRERHLFFGVTKGIISLEGCLFFPPFKMGGIIVKRFRW
jgi:hypothetical protein